MFQPQPYTSHFNPMGASNPMLGSHLSATPFDATQQPTFQTDFFRAMTNEDELAESYLQQHGLQSRIRVWTNNVRRWVS
jgi:hypothetical protein